MNLSAIAISVGLVTGVVASVGLIRQCRKPAGLPGRLIVRMMNRSHRALIAWALSHVPLLPDSIVLDVGCGGGETVRSLNRAVRSGRIVGIDYSGASVAVARRRNADLIATGRVDIQQAKVSRLPFATGTFDVITAIETHYYWPDLVQDLREVRRVLRSEGRVALVVESYAGKRLRRGDALAMRVLATRLLSAQEHAGALRAAGFIEIQLHEHPTNGWLCVTASNG